MNIYKGEILNLADFKTLASFKLPDATEDIIEAAFKKVAGNEETLNFHEAKEALLFP